MSGVNPKFTHSAPPEAWEPAFKFARFASRPLERFLQIEAASGILLLTSAALALYLANSPWAASYTGLWHTELGIQIGGFEFKRSLEWFVNDVLMAVFFFVVGMEIRREVHHGELSDWRRALLPGVAALGGMLIPALFYTLLAGEGEARAGWGIPMATDIAFALGVLALLGARVPPALRVLLLALAVIDDLGAIIVIAVFYSSGVSLTGFVVAGIGVAAISALRAIGVRAPAGYFIPAFVVWAGVYSAGVHPTIAGVLVGLLTPVRAWIGSDGLVAELRLQVEAWKPDVSENSAVSHTAELLQRVDFARREAVSPAEYLIGRLHPWVAFLIMPLFALANAGVELGGAAGTELGVSVAVFVGLVLGKPVGVLLASGLVLRLGLAKLPLGLGARHLVVLGIVAGIGFTMSLFVAQLAFKSEQLLAAAKVGVLAASTVAMILGVGLGYFLLGTSPTAGAASSADEAEASTEL